MFIVVEFLFEVRILGPDSAEYDVSKEQVLTLDRDIVLATVINKSNPTIASILVTRSTKSSFGYRLNLALNSKTNFKATEIPHRVFLLDNDLLYASAISSELLCSAVQIILVFVALTRLLTKLFY